MVSDDLAETISLWERSVDRYSDAVERCFGFGNINKSNKTNFSREKLHFRDKVTWYDSEGEKDYIKGLFESIPWEKKRI